MHDESDNWTTADTIAALLMVAVWLLVLGVLVGVGYVAWAVLT